MLLERWRSILYSALAGMMLCAVGCVSEAGEPVYPPAVSISQNSQGLVTLSWPSQRGYNYRLVVLGGPKPVFDKKVYAGTGEQIEVQFMRDPQKPLPAYAVKPERIEP